MSPSHIKLVKIYVQFSSILLCMFNRWSVRKHKSIQFEQVLSVKSGTETNTRDETGTIMLQNCIFSEFLCVLYYCFHA